MPSDLDADLHVLNQLTRGKPNGAGPGGGFGGPGLCLDSAPHEAEKLAMGFDDKNKWLKHTKLEKDDLVGVWKISFQMAINHSGFRHAFLCV